MTTTKRFILRFSTDIGRILQISIPRARADKDAAAVDAAMRGILENGVVATADSGIIADIYNAQLVTTVQRPII